MVARRLSSETSLTSPEMKTARLRPRRTFSSRRRRNNNTNLVPSLVWRILQAGFAVFIFMWIGTVLKFLARDEAGNGLRERDSATTRPQHVESLDLRRRPTLALDLEVGVPEGKNGESTVATIRISLLHDECPKAYEFVMWITNNQEAECRPCTMYRGEPVPSYWGSEDYPDRWDNGGRWGPPYALVQGGFQNNKVGHIEREAHRPAPLKRGMVAWAGARGVHFFVALADHPEWGHEHTVWGRVLEEDMLHVDALVRERPLKVLERHVPVVTNFVTPIPFRMRYL